MTTQPDPTPTGGPGMHDLLIADLWALRNPSAHRVAAELAARRDVGLATYGTPLQAGNGRDALRDLLDEVLDGMAYARQARCEGLFDSLPDGGSAIEHLLAGTAGALVELMDRRAAVGQ